MPSTFRSSTRRMWNRLVQPPGASSSRSPLVMAIEQRPEIIIARHTRPAARGVPPSDVPGGKCLGIAKGTFEAPDTNDSNHASSIRFGVVCDRRPESRTKDRARAQVAVAAFSVTVMAIEIQ